MRREPRVSDSTKPDGGFDPVDRPAFAAAAVNAPAPASSETLIRYMKGMPLDFNPGEKFAYSNFLYIILGRVIERLGGVDGRPNRPDILSAELVAEMTSSWRCIVSKWRVLLRSWLVCSSNPGRRGLVAPGNPARHDEHPRAHV